MSERIKWRDISVNRRFRVSIVVESIVDGEDWRLWMQRFLTNNTTNERYVDTLVDFLTEMAERWKIWLRRWENWRQR
jgi:hypothetical protein